MLVHWNRDLAKNGAGHIPKPTCPPCPDPHASLRIEPLNDDILFVGTLQHELTTKLSDHDTSEGLVIDALLIVQADEGPCENVLHELRCVFGQGLQNCGDVLCDLWLVLLDVR